MTSGYRLGFWSPLMVAILLGAWPVSASAESSEGQPKATVVVVPGLQAHQGVAAGTAQVLTDLLLEGLLARHGVRAIGPADIVAILKAEEKKLLLGCSDESCMAELAGALGADWLVAGNVGKLEDIHIISLQLIDPRAARVTARASTRIGSLKKAPESIGPLIDKLLGAQPRVRTPAALAGIQREPARAVLDVAAHCALAKAYWRLVDKGEYSDFVAAKRRELLDDMARTRFKGQLKDKSLCFWSNYGSVEPSLQTRWLRSTTEESGVDLRLRHLEAVTFSKQIELLKEAHQRGLEMEKNGTGKRLTSAPFEVRPVELKGREDSVTTRAYRSAYPQGQKVVAKALEAARESDAVAFAALFLKGDERAQKRSWAKVQKRFKDRFSGDPCPWYIRGRRQVALGSDVLEKQKRLRGCVRWMRKKGVSTYPVTMERVGDDWRIVSW